MSNIAKPNTFSSSTPISSSQVNANFDTIYNDYNGNVSEANLADDAVTTDKVADSAVTTAKIASSAVTPTKWTNPYKFSAYRSGAHTSSSSPAKVTPDTESFDSNSNFASGTYTVPVAGFYYFSACMGNTAASATPIFTYIYKNGAVALRGSGASSASGGTCSLASGMIQCAANDTIEVYFIGGAGSTMETGADKAFFQGFLVSQT